MDTLWFVLYISFSAIAIGVIVALWIYALLQIAKADMDQVAKAIWVLIILVIPVVGAIAWFAIGSKPRTLQ